MCGKRLATLLLNTNPMVSQVASTLRNQDYWFHNLCIGDETFATLVFDTASLKRIISNLDKKRSVSGGDNNASRMYLLNLQKLFSSDVIKAFKDAA